MRVFNLLILLPLVALLSACGGESKPPVDGGHFNPSSAQVNQSVVCPSAPALNVPDQTDSVRYNFDQLNEVLKAEGLIGLVHGAVNINQQFVFAFEPTGNIFNIERMSLSSDDAQVRSVLGTLNRHDVIRVKGEILDNERSLRHIKVSEISIDQRYPTPQNYNHDIDENLFDGRDKVRMLGKVHAVFAGGSGLAFEHEDMILPVIVSPSLIPETERLFRNDKLVLNLTLRRTPGAPLHFYTDESAENPIELVDSMANCHGHPTTLNGELVRFLQSPQINTDVYAVKVRDSNNIVRNFTFFPDADFSSPNFVELFNNLNDKAAAAWTEGAATAQPARNHMVNPQIQVTVKGRMNIVTNDQANPQIYISKVEDLTFSQ